MKKYCFAITCTLLGLCLNAMATTWINHADEITEEWLFKTGAETGYTEHVRHFKKLFNKINVRTFLEFGVGFSTKYFIDHSEKVISVEFVTPGSGPEWLKYCINLYRDYPSWTSIAYFAGKGLDTSWAPNKYMGADSVYQAAAFQPVYYRSYTLIDPSFLDDLSFFIKQQVTSNEIDVAFVDAGVCIRGDLVQLLFNEVPVIAAHDINSNKRRRPNTGDDVYGYGRLIVPDNYEEIHIPFGMGTAFWIKKEDQYQELIEYLHAYANSKEEKY